MNPKLLPSLPLACCFLLLIGATIKHANAESDDPKLSLCLDCMLRIKDAMDEVDDMLTASKDYLVDECDAMDTAVTQICHLNVKNSMSVMKSIFDANYNDTWICHPACDLTDSNNTLDNLLRPKLFGPGKKSSNTNKKLMMAVKVAASVSDVDRCDQCREKAFNAKGNVVQFQLLNDCDLILLDACFMNPPVLAKNCLNAGKAVFWPMYTEFNSNFQVGRICKPVC